MTTATTHGYFSPLLTFLAAALSDGEEEDALLDMDI